MRNTLLKIVTLLTLVSTLGTCIPLSMTANADEFDNSFNVDIDGFDCKTENGKVFVYPNNSDKPRYVKGDDYKVNNFRSTKLMIFDKDGLLIEAGGEIYANSETVTGSPQQGVYIPAGGFLVAFYSVSDLTKAFNTAMEGAMLYNATMAVIYEMHGSVDGNKLTIEYNNPKDASSDAKKFLFVGNSSTYFNGTPIIFKGLAEAAGIEIDVDYSTFGSAFLSEFADENHDRGKFLRNKLKTESYDYVVLQDAAKSSYSSSKPQVETLLPLIEENGADALLYMRYSAASTVDQIRENAKKHHLNYATMAKDFDLVCAPSADAFVYCAERYPEINLYADDGGHHSKAGAYLIACTWLYSYLGVDPTDNGYDAQLGEATAKKLWECAKIACEEGYAFEGIDTTYTDNEGNKYNNIAEGKSYTVTGAVYDNESWTDTKNGKPIGKLTDGFMANAGDDGAIGAYNGKNGHSVTIDLGSVSQIKHIYTDMFGNTGWGIPDPKDMVITVSISNDGKSFTEAGTAVMSDEQNINGWPKREFNFEFESLTEARYVKLSYTSQLFIWSSEILVHGISGETEGDESSIETSSDILLSESNTDESANDSDSAAEPTRKSLAWLYWLIGGVVLAGGIAAAVMISKKK